MKKFLSIFLIAAGLILSLDSCASTKASGSDSARKFMTVTPGRADISNVDYEAGAVTYGSKSDGYENVTVVKCSKSESRNIVTVSLSEFAEQEIDLNFSCDVKVVDSTGNTNDIIWMVNEPVAGFPQIARDYAENGKWTHFAGSKTLTLSGNRQFYISAGGLSKENLTVYLRNFHLTITGDKIGKEKVPQVNWKDAPGLAEAYKPYFDYIGFATPLNGVLDSAEIFQNLSHQANCITMENEFKPDFVFAWQKPSKLKDFVAEDGNTYKVPDGVPSYANVGKILNLAKSVGVKMRGHVLVWHNQTPDWFFKEKYSSSGALVDEATMNARLEWYIKGLLEYVKTWEDKNYNGERIVLAWDVVNEAASDNATAKQWLRTDSPWYRIYKDADFIVNAFRYANKYAPEDVLLCYNDYGCASSAKAFAICQIVDAIQSAEDARIDCVGMQTHVGMNTSVQNFEISVKKFLAKGVDVQITEMDMGQDGQSYNSDKMKDKYKEFFTMFLNNRKTEDKKGIRGITFWGILDERSWIYNSNGSKQHPLLFEKKYVCKPAFYGVLEAVQEYTE